jgi:hypothetical protein
VWMHASVTTRTVPPSQGGRWQVSICDPLRLSRISGVGKLIADGMYQYDLYHEVPTIGIAAWGSVRSCSARSGDLDLRYRSCARSLLGAPKNRPRILPVLAAVHTVPTLIAL